MTEPEHVSTARAVYDATAEVYAQLVGTELTPAFEVPIDRAMLVAFVEYVTDGRAGPVADIGCGPGRVAAFLAASCLDVVGIDLSQAMLAVARDAHPAIRFDEGRLTALPLADHSLAGAVCWYSIIHTPPEHLPEVFAELWRVLAHDGHLLVAFQAGDGESVHRPDAYGTGRPLMSYRHSSDNVARQLTAARLRVLPERNESLTSLTKPRGKPFSSLDLARMAVDTHPVSSDMGVPAVGQRPSLGDVMRLQGRPILDNALDPPIRKWSTLTQTNHYSGCAPSPGVEGWFSDS